MLTTQGLIFATAMAVSAGTIILLDHFREKTNPTSAADQKKILKSCLSTSGSKKEQGSKRNRKKKRVRFANDVKDSSANGELYRKEHRKVSAEILVSNSCGNEIVGVQKMPANHMALYSGILKDRVHRIECS